MNHIFKNCRFRSKRIYSCVGGRGCKYDARYRATLLARLKTIEENQRLMVNLLQSVAASVGSGGEGVDDVLPAPVCSLEELDDLYTKLTDETFKKKLTLYLSSLGGHSLGDTVRRIILKSLEVIVCGPHIV
ncbi:uncharacterized protein LOC135201575 [Macrobrachium nipponense]|uniref:uncharacterized protein LOC135201575 n=1 Tax=Macrobrachium nipponense TaxID=159736 RepID=UPI0030C8BF2C